MSSFVLGSYYFLSVAGWPGVIGFCVIMFFGFFIDLDHFVDNRTRIKQVAKALKRGKITKGDVAIEKTNHLHSWWAMAGVIIVCLVIGGKLGTLSFLAYFIHMFVIDILDCDHQQMPKNNPLPSQLHRFFYRRLKFFRKLCFNRSSAVIT